MKCKIRHCCMAWLIAAAALAVAAPAIADYESCMKFCITEHSFSQCNLQCGLAGGRKKGDGEEGKGDEINVRLESCDAANNRLDAIFQVIEEHFGPSALLYSPLEENILEVEFYPFEDEHRSCTAIATFSYNCDLSFVYECESPKRD